MSKATKTQIIERVVKELDAISGDAPDGDHSEADRIVLEALRELGAGEIVDAYKRLESRAPWWATA